MSFEERLRAAHRREMELLRELTAEADRVSALREEVADLRLRLDAVVAFADELREESRGEVDHE